MRRKAKCSPKCLRVRNRREAEAVLYAPSQTLALASFEHSDGRVLAADMMHDVMPSATLVVDGTGISALDDSVLDCVGSGDVSSHMTPVVSTEVTRGRRRTVMMRIMAQARPGGRPGGNLGTETNTLVARDRSKAGVALYTKRGQGRPGRAGPDRPRA